MPEQYLTPEEIERAMQLMANAGWVARADPGREFGGLELKREALPEAYQLHATYRKLGCQSARDILSVVVLLHWYLFKESML